MELIKYLRDRIRMSKKQFFKLLSKGLYSKFKIKTKTRLHYLSIKFDKTSIQ